ncbi:hypothetical protein B2J93_4935 [Marssonina coronariae]|uniref:Uncharacterized protein n=1 Tax=Diplocarpon coronariae TaxID=2795749 RepID=A0A218ZE15_9HELO|nr:hypothetical protein B2J93_4935 [Marssonina coronariae]
MFGSHHGIEQASLATTEPGLRVDTDFVLNTGELPKNTKPTMYSGAQHLLALQPQRPPGPNNTPTCPRVPLEVRRLVYTLLLPSPTSPVRGPRSSSPPGPEPHPSSRKSYPLPSSASDHQIRAEALPLLYGSAGQMIHATLDDNVWLHKTRRSDLVLSSAVFLAHQTCAPVYPPWLWKNGQPNRRVWRPTRGLSEVKKGIKTFCEWLSGADIRTMKIG